MHNGVSPMRIPEQTCWDFCSETGKKETKIDSPPLPFAIEGEILIFSIHEKNISFLLVWSDASNFFSALAFPTA